MFCDLEEALKDEIGAGHIAVVPDVTAAFGALDAKFPTRPSRIAWERIGDRQEIDVLSSPRTISSDELQAELAAHRASVESWFVSLGIDAETEVMWLGDMCDSGFRMPLAVFFEHFELLFSMPQHSYVLPDDARWCLNYVMEGQLFFGMSPDS